MNIKTRIKLSHIYIYVYRAPKSLGIQNVWYLCKIIGIFLKVTQSDFQGAEIKDKAVLWMQSLKGREIKCEAHDAELRTLCLISRFGGTELEFQDFEARPV